MKARKKNRVVINVAERHAAFTILIGIALVVLISIALILFFPYAMTPQQEATRITEVSRNYVPCTYNTQCLEWQECKNNFCVPQEGRCVENSDCEEWQECRLNGLICVKKIGRCESDNECMYGEYCDLVTHYCVFDPKLIE